MPGALLLAEALSRVEHANGAKLYLQKILSAKFLKPVLPGDHITVRFERGRSQAEHRTLSIALYSAGTLVAKFILELTPMAGRGSQ